MIITLERAAEEAEQREVEEAVRRAEEVERSEVRVPVSCDR